jgi:hypothetical protein
LKVAAHNQQAESSGRPGYRDEVMLMDGGHPMQTGEVSDGDEIRRLTGR